MASDLLQIDAHRRLYNIMNSSWPRGPRVFITIAGVSDVFAKEVIIPLAFLQGSGCNDWAFVYYIMSQVVQGKGILSSQETNSPVITSEAPAEGNYIYEPDRTSGAVFTWSRGPQGRSAYRAPLPDESWDDRDSGITTATESTRAFREDLKARDKGCVLTRKLASEAAHLVPRQRLDLYRTLMGADFGGAYSTGCGLLLNAQIHKAYDAFKLSFFPKDGKIFMHSFTEYRNFHGKDISKFVEVDADFQDELHPPDPRLMLWHYAQCCMMRFRGFTHGMSQDKQ